MRKFFINIILFSSPIIILLTPYFVFDPFKVLYHYDSLTPEPGEPMYININRSMVSTVYYIKHNEKYHYDSFIFGSSRSGYYRVKDWKTHIGDTVSCFHFDEYGGSLYMINKKVLYASRHSEMKNALICIDSYVLYESDPPSTPLHACPPVLNGNKDIMKFQSLYLRTYLNPLFFPYYLYWKITGNVTEKMKQLGVIDTTPYYLNIKTNEVGSDEKVYGLGYTATKDELLVPRIAIPPRYPSYIGEKEYNMLQEIKNVLDNKGCDYRVIINPVFDQRKLSEDDMDILSSLFGDRLYDFSGINEYTEDPNNYFDTSHFNATVGKDILDRIYDQEQ